MVQSAQCAFSVNEVGSRQLVQGFQGHSGAVPTAPNYRGTSRCFCLSAQFPLVHKNGQGLFSYNKNMSSLVRLSAPESPAIKNLLPSSRAHRAKREHCPRCGPLPIISTLRALSSDCAQGHRPPCPGGPPFSSS